MKNKKIRDNTGIHQEKDVKKVSRKEAIKKLGKCAALTAATVSFLSTKASAAGSPRDPGYGW